MFSLIIIDDEPVAAKQFGETFDWSNYGFQLVQIFSNSEQALSFLKKNTVDLVLTDIKMPAVTGVDIAKFCSLLQTPPFVVFLSAYSDFDYAKQALMYNVCDYLVKPFTYSDVERVLVKVYNLLSSRNDSGLFSNSLEIIRQQTVFSDLVLKNIPSIKALKERLSEINLPAFVSDSECALIKVTITDYDTYINKTWKHGQEKLYGAIAYLAASKNGIFSSFFAYENNSFDIIAIKNNENFKETLTGYLKQLESNLKQLLFIDAVFEISYVDSLSDFISKNQAEPILSQNKDKIIEKSMEFMHSNYNTDISLDDVARFVSLSKVYFCSYFKKVTGENFFDVLNRYRIEKAKEMLSSGNIKISAIAETVGYKSVPYFYKIFTKYTKLTPSDYRKQLKREDKE